MLAGSCTLSIAARDDAREIVLDVKGLNIGIVSGNGQMLPFTIGESDGERGAPMTVQLNGAREITIATKHRRTPTRCNG